MLGRPRIVLVLAGKTLGRPRSDFSTFSTHRGRYGAP